MEHLITLKDGSKLEGSVLKYMDKNIQTLDNLNPLTPPNFKGIFFLRKEITHPDMTCHATLFNIDIWGWGRHANLLVRVSIFCPSIVSFLFFQKADRSSPELHF